MDNNQPTAHWSYCGCALELPYMLKQLLGSSLMEILKLGCPGNVKSGETSLSWLYPRSIGSQCNIKDQRYCVWSLGPWKSFQVTVSIKNTWPSNLVTDASEALWEMEGQKLGNRRGRDTGSLTHSLTLSLQRMQEQEQYAANSGFRHCCN